MKIRGLHFRSTSKTPAPGPSAGAPETADPQDVRAETVAAAPPEPAKKRHLGLKIGLVAMAVAAPVLGTAMQSLDIIPSPILPHDATVVEKTIPAQPGQQGPYRVTKDISIPGDGSWDYDTYDAATHQLFIGHGSRIEVLNVDTGKLQVLPRTDDMIGVHRIELVPQQNKAFVADGMTNKVTVYNLKTDQPMGEISVGKGPDNIVYDTSSKMLFVMNEDGGSMSVINPATDQVVNTIKVGANPQEGVADGQGHLFVALNDSSQVAEINTSTMQVTSHYSLGSGQNPTTLALDSAHHVLYVGCDNNKEVMIDTANHQVLGSVAIGTDEDSAAYDSQSHLMFQSNGDGTLDVIGGNQQQGFKVDEVVKTGPNAHTMALDPTTGNIYLPSGDTLMSQAGGDSTIDAALEHINIPGTFHIVEVSPDTATG